MPRNLTDDQLAAIKKPFVRLARYVEIATTPVMRFWDGSGQVTVLGYTWYGTENFGTIDGLEGSLNTVARSLSLSLFGLPNDGNAKQLVAASAATNYRGVSVKIYFGITDLNTDVPLADPTQVWLGLCDTLEFKAGETVSCVLTAEHYSSHLRRSNGFRATPANHNARVKSTPRDGFYDFNNRLTSTIKVTV